jgi:hypothetical protein
MAKIISSSTTLKYKHFTKQSTYVLSEKTSTKFMLFPAAFPEAGPGIGKYTSLATHKGPKPFGTSSILCRSTTLTTERAQRRINQTGLRQSLRYLGV